MSRPEDAFPDGPGVLYHYTDARGLLGIVQTSSLWATDAEFLNDAQELRFGRSHLRAALLAAADALSPTGTDKGGPDDSRATIMRSAAGHLEPDPSPGRRNAHSAYVACFCEADDLLSQWRGYGSSGGLSVGFLSSSLGAVEPPHWKDPLEGIDVIPEELRPAPPPVTLVKVRYGDAAIQPAMDEVVNRIAPQPRAHPGVTGFHRAKAVALPALAGIKHAAFSEEAEWRLIVMGLLGEVAVRFRAGRLGVIPYVELPLPEKAIAEVVVGPGENRQLRTQGVERLLAEHGMHDAVVRQSETPFRG
jgi:hypothetical protein